MIIIELINIKCRTKIAQNRGTDFITDTILLTLVFLLHHMIKYCLNLQSRYNTKVGI